MREYKYEKIAKLIEDYLQSKRGTVNEIELSALEIRKWPEVEKLCENSCYANICRAMNAVKLFPACYIKGKEESSTYTMKFKLL